MKETWEDDRDPLVALRAGDPEPFEAFVTTELRTFVGFFLRLGASSTEAEDLTQDLALRLYQHADTYERRGRFAAYAFRVARNLWIDRSRRRAGRPRSASAGEEASAWLERVPDAADEPLTGLSRREEADRIQGALEELPEHHRLVFELGVVQELSYPEIGAILEIPVGTVKSRMFHAVRKLRGALGAELDGTIEGGEVA